MSNDNSDQKMVIEFYGTGNMKQKGETYFRLNYDLVIAREEIPWFVVLEKKIFEIFLTPWSNLIRPGKIISAEKQVHSRNLASKLLVLSVGIYSEHYL